MLDRPVVWGQPEPKRELTGFSSWGPAVSPSALTAPSPQIHTTQLPSTLRVLHVFSWAGLARPPSTHCHCSPVPSPVAPGSVSVQILTPGTQPSDKGRWGGHLGFWTPSVLALPNQASLVSDQPHSASHQARRWPQTQQTPSRSHFPSALEAKGRRRPCYLWLSRKASGGNPSGTLTMDGPIKGMKLCHLQRWMGLETE